MALAAAMAAAPALAQGIQVSSSADSGAGTLRAALAEAASMGGAVITLNLSAPIELDSPLSYTGTGALTILGNTAEVRAAGDFDLFQSVGGGDLSISGVTFSGPGGWSIENRGDAGDSAGKGVFVQVPTTATGTLSVMLDAVTVQGVANHGIHVSDCSLADACGSGGGGAGDGSEASIAISLNEVQVIDAGNGKFDADGLRVDERGAGDIMATMTGGRFERVGADGVELDEGQGGDVRVTATGVTFIENGNYCDPALLSAFLPTEDEGEFDAGAKAEADIPGPVTGSPDDSCIEREVDLYDDGSVEEYAFGLDLDDGFDIDEAGDGSISATIVASQVTDNRDEGLDFDEEGAGSILLSLIDVTATGNTDDGVKLTEEDAGDILGAILRSSAEGNGGKGIVLEAEGEGAFAVQVVGVTTSGNDDSDDTGIEALSEGSRPGTLTLLDAQIADGVDADNVTVIE